MDSPLWQPCLMPREAAKHQSMIAMKLGPQVPHEHLWLLIPSLLLPSLPPFFLTYTLLPWTVRCRLSFVRWSQVQDKKIGAREGGSGGREGG